MNHAQRNTIHTHLESLGRIDAQRIAHDLGLPREVVYEALVSLESAGLARVEVSRQGRGIQPVREWVAA